MTSTPDVSVVLAVKNEAKHIEEALGSILDQRGVSVDVVVVDDGSDDDTVAIASRFVGPTLRLYKNPGVGKVSAFNYGVAQARGRFVCIFAGDDIMPPESLNGRLRAIEAVGGAAVGLCKIETLCDDPRHSGIVIPRRSGRGALSGASPLMNRAALARLFPVPETLPNEDTWLEVAITYLPSLNVVHGDIVGCQWRLHDNNSMNLRFDFDLFNSRYTQRMVAFSLFRHQHASELDAAALAELDGLIECETARSRGRALGVVLSRTRLVPKLRALCYTNPVMYGIRRRLYGLLSGW